MNPTLSLIIPMFNARATIGATLESLLVAETSTVEILLVDDGSTDGSVDYVRENFSTALSEGVLLLIQQPNQGVSVARNLGLDRARGDYIGFVDADDMVDTAYLPTLLAEMASRPSDIIEFGFSRWREQPLRASTATQYVNPRFGYFERSQIERGVFGLSHWYPWARIYHRRLFREIRFPAGVYFGEDLMTVSRLYLLANTITSLSAVLYRYRVNPAGATLNNRPEYVVKLTEFYLSILHEKGDCVDLIKVALQFCIYSCQHSMHVPYRLDATIERDIRRIRWNVAMYRFLPHRRIRVLWFPEINRFFADLFNRGPARADAS